MTKLSIIVPVYNVEKYIRTCIESIYRQGLDENIFEVIIVNDGTKDNSMEMIADIVKAHSNISVIEQENQGLSVARNNGIAAAKGEYIFMPDSDDLLIDNSLPFLLNKATETKADLIVADFLMRNNEIIEYFKLDSKQKDGQTIEMTGKELFLGYLNPSQCYVWRTLYRRRFLTDNHITFFPKIRYQDVPFTHECYLKANKCIRVSWLLNIYRKERENAATFSFNLQKAKDLCLAMKKTWELRALDDHTPETLLKLQDNVYASFTLLITLISYSFFTLSESKEIVSYMKEQIPDLRFKNGIKQKTTSYLFRTIPYLYLIIHVAIRRFIWMIYR